MKILQAPYTVSFFQGEDDSATQVIAGKNFRLNHRSIGRFFFGTPSPFLHDLLRVAMSVYVIDRVAKRKKRSEGGHWPRSLRTTIEVLQPDFWSADQVREVLTECVDFVSGDDWNFNFVEDRAKPSSEDSYLTLTDPFAPNLPLICLYSGGIDSAAGLASRIHECPERRVIPVTVWHQPRQRNRIQEHYCKLRERWGVEITPLIVKAAMMWPPQFRDEEPSQRCRSFLFAAVAGAASVMSGVSSVEVYESGIGAINLPLMAGMVGSQATRGCHPHFFRLVSKVVSLVAGREVSYRLPFIGQTKGEIVRLLANSGLEDLARSTVSCVHYPLRESPHKQCGVCPACILRRQAMFVADINEAEGTYKYDLFGPSASVNRVASRSLRYLKACLMQVVQLAEIEGKADLPRRFRRHIYGTGIIRPGESATPFIELLLRYRHEWLAIAEYAKSHGWSWGTLMTPAHGILHEGRCNASA